MPFFTVTSCVISTSTSRRHEWWQIWTTGEHASCFRGMDLFSKNRNCLRTETVSCWGTIRTGWERGACWDVLHSGSWVSHGHCIRKVCSRNMCVFLIWIYSFETWSPASTGLYMHLHFSQSVVYVGGISFCLGMWSLWALCTVSPCITRSVCSDSFVVGSDC